MASNTLEYYIEGLLSCGATDPNSEIHHYLSPVDNTEIQQALANLENIKDEKTTLRGSEKQVWQGQQNYKIGKGFEKVIEVLFKSSRVLSVATNVHSTTGEIDIVLSVKPLAQKVSFIGLRTHILSEAKCHDKSPKSEWVTEMMGNLDQHGADMGFIFVYCKPKKLEREFRQSIALSAAAKKFIVPIGKTQFKKIAEGGKLLDVLQEQFVASSTHSTALNV